MKCHYDVLEISREADSNEIKSSYRKLALKWHPDKNLDNTEDAKEQFQLVQQAYEVLSDPQERAWYDKHREQILRGSNSEFQDNTLDVFQYFTTSCFKGYGDDEKGFYTVYRTVFDEIIKEDLEFIEDKDEFCDIPRFGDSRSDYDEVVGPFYSYWTSYSTKKSYVWLDPYDIKETRERRILKLIEKENKKSRQKAKKERNEEVRNLVAFVRKRDKRVLENQKKLTAKILENRQKQEELSKQKRLERKMQLHNDSGTQAEWTKFDNVKSGLEEIEKDLAAQFGEELSNSEDEEIEDDGNLYCVACNKLFKTPKAFVNHESSKKHKENVEKLRDIMLEEEGEDSDDEDVEEIEIGGSTNNSEEDLDQISSDNSIEILVSEKQKKKKNRKSKNVLKVHHHSESAEETHCDLPTTKKVEDSDDNFEHDVNKKSKKKNRKSKTKSGEDNNTTETIDRIEIGTCNGGSSIKTSKKNKQTRNKESERNLDEIDLSHCCVTCKSQFSSKNKLFDHLKKTGHGVYLNKNVKSGKKLVSDREK